MEFTGKATMVLINSMGMPLAHQVNIKKIFQDGKELVVHYTAKGKRTVVGAAFSKSLVIGKGWQDIKGAMNTSPQGGKWVGYDREFFKTLGAQLSDVVVSI